MADKVDELPVFQKAMDFWSAVHAILQRPAVRRNRKLWQQISDANDSITANMREGFEQPSDDAFANFLRYAKASTAEVIARLHSMNARGQLTQQELQQRIEMADELGRMLGGFIKYLRLSGFKDRGTYRVKHVPPERRGEK